MHSGAQNAGDPLASLPADVNGSARAVLGEVARFLAEAIQSETMVPEVRIEMLLAFGNWLKLMSSRGEPFRRHVGLAFADTDKTAALRFGTPNAVPLAAMLCKHASLTGPASKVWHDLWLSMIADVWFKKQVRRVYNRRVTVLTAVGQDIAGDYSYQHA